jgi:heptaprenylglyceryl phosphate synthase
MPPHTNSQSNDIFLVIANATDSVQLFVDSRTVVAADIFKSVDDALYIVILNSRTMVFVEEDTSLAAPTMRAPTEV